MQGLIFDIKQYAVHDGPGIRTTIFFKGCPLNCWWCHNPESQDAKTQDYINKTIINGISVEQKKQFGKIMTVDEIMAEIRKDILFYDDSNGGVTFSGGEPLLQADFLYEILKKCKAEEIHTCVDTSGFSSHQKFKKIIPYTDLFLFDIKHFDDNKHKKYTGVSNKQIFENLDLLIQSKANIRIRFPLIPGINDCNDNLTKMRLFLKKHPQIHLDILPYHNIAKHKYKKIDKQYKLNNLKEPDEEYIKKIRTLL